MSDRDSKSVIKRLAVQMPAYELGKRQAAQGFGPDDYPTDYTDAERDAWRRGWKEWHEGQP